MMPHGNPGLRDGGFSLIEVLVAAAILGIVMLGIASLFAKAGQNVGEHGVYRQALRIAQSEIEAIHAAAPGDPKLRITDADGVQVTGGSMIETVDDAGFVRLYPADTAVQAPLTWASTCAGLETLPGTACTGLYRRVAWVDDNEIDYDGSAEDYKHVTIVVAWADPLNTGILHRIDLETYVAK